MKISVIRPLRNDQTEEAIRFLTRIFGPSYESEACYEIPASLMPDNPDQRQTFVASIDDKIVGIAQIVVSYMHTDTFNLTWVSTDPALRGKGLGREMVETCEEYISLKLLAGRPGSVVIVDYTRKTNKNSHFYKNLGYMPGPATHDGLPLMIKILNLK